MSQTSVTAVTAEKVNLLDLDRRSMEQFFHSMGEPAFRAKQLLQWIHQVGVTDFSLMTNVSKSLRNVLAEKSQILPLESMMEQISKDGTCKWLLRLSDGNAIETVFIPEAKRGTLCVSSQVGCVVNCTFCSTAQQGFSRNLTCAEIIGQVYFAVRRLSKDGTHDHQITNVVMMGMGEPLLNFENVVKAMDLMMDDFSYGLSRRRVTLSTSGVLPAMRELAVQSPVALAVSLHAPNDELRDQLMPINRKYPLKDLMQVCRNYFKKGSRRRVTFEYVMLEGINDSMSHAKQLIKLLHNVPSKVNLIPFNPFPNTPYRCSSREVIFKFRDVLLAAGINAIVRKTRGEDVDGACGQLVGRVQDITRRQERLSQKLARIPIQTEYVPQVKPSQAKEYTQCEL